MVLRKIFGPKREEDGSWRKLHNDELHSLSSSPNIVRVTKLRTVKWAGHVALMGGRGAYRVLVGRPEGKKPLGRPRRRWEDNIKVYLREIGIDGANWIHLAEVGPNGGLLLTRRRIFGFHKESRIFFVS
jgi:hypothetical protein